MRPLIGFQFIRVKSFEEAWETMERYPHEYRLLAGGTDLLVKLKRRQIHTPLLISLKGIPNLHGIAEQEDRIEIGTLATVGEIVRSQLLQERCPLLPMAAGHLGSNQIRNLATIGGNLCNASPAADLSLALLCLEAALEIKGPQGIRIEKVEDFFQEPGVTSLKEKEILASILVPIHKGEWVWNYQKLSNRKALEIGTVNVAVGLKRQQEICKEARVGLGAVAPTPIRAKKAEAHVIGKKLEPVLVGQVGLLGAKESSPIDDIRATAAYRQEMVVNLLRRALTAAWVTSGSQR